MYERKIKVEIGDAKLSLAWNQNENLVVIPNVSEREKYLETHIHSYYEVFFLIDGSIDIITHNEKMQCRNSIVVVPPHLPHFTIFQNAKARVIRLKIEKIEQNCEYQVFDNFCKKFSTNITLLPIDEKFFIYISEFEKCQENAFLSKYQENHLLNLIFTEIFSKLYSDASTQSSEKHQNYIKTIECLLSKRYAEKLLISDLAKELYLSTKQVARIIKKEYNCTFSELLTAQRLWVAKMLLARSNMEVNQIALSVGYEYPANFYNNFKKAYNMTPNEYRKGKTN